MCGNILVEANNDFKRNICHYCNVSLEFMPPEYNGRYWEDVREEYVREHILPDPEKRKAYKNRREVLELELQLIDDEAKRSSNISNTPKCPTCGSDNIAKISGAERGVSVAAWGLFSKKINKTFKCRHCGYTW